MAEPLFHITARDEWDPDAAEHRPAGYDRDGFVHLCTRAQVPGVLDRWFAGRAGLLLVELDPAELGEVRWEPGAGSDPGPFPHHYAPLPRAAVVAVAPLA